MYDYRIYVKDVPDPFLVTADNIKKTDKWGDEWWFYRGDQLVAMVSTFDVRIMLIEPVPA